MAHQPQLPTRYVCANCQVMHAGTSIHQGGGEHTFEKPDACGACGDDEFVAIEEWARHHE